MSIRGGPPCLLPPISHLFSAPLCVTFRTCTSILAPGHGSVAPVSGAHPPDSICPLGKASRGSRWPLLPRPHIFPSFCQHWHSSHLHGWASAVSLLRGPFPRLCLAKASLFSKSHFSFYRPWGSLSPWADPGAPLSHTCLQCLPPLSCNWLSPHLSTGLLGWGPRAYICLSLAPSGVPASGRHWVLVKGWIKG